MFLTGAATWAFDIEEPAAFSTALLAVVDRASGFTYVVSIAVSSMIVAGVFLVWHRRVYSHRARYLYQSTKGDDHVLVPMRGDYTDATAMFGGRLAAAHDAGKVVLFDLLDPDEGSERPDGPAVVTDGGVSAGAPESTATKTHAGRLERCADAVESTVGVPCEVVVAERGSEPPAKTALRTARESNCDLIVTPYEEGDGGLSPFVKSLFRTDMDVVVHRSVDGRTEWSGSSCPFGGPATSPGACWISPAGSRARRDGSASVTVSARPPSVGTPRACSPTSWRPSRRTSRRGWPTGPPRSSSRPRRHTPTS